MDPSILTKGELKFLIDLLNADGINFAARMKRDIVTLEDKLIAAFDKAPDNVVPIRPAHEGAPCGGGD